MRDNNGVLYRSSINRYQGIFQNMSSFTGFELYIIKRHSHWRVRGVSRQSIFHCLDSMTEQIVLTEPVRWNEHWENDRRHLMEPKPMTIFDRQTLKGQKTR